MTRCSSTTSTDMAGKPENPRTGRKRLRPVGGEHVYTEANYWSALLWRQLMGTTVLESGLPIQAGLQVYAHCLRGRGGGVAVLAINTKKPPGP